MTRYAPPDFQVLGTVEELTAGKEVSGNDFLQGSVPQQDNA